MHEGSVPYGYPRQRKSAHPVSSAGLTDPFRSFLPFRLPYYNRHRNCFSLAQIEANPPALFTTFISRPTLPVPSEASSTSPEPFITRRIAPFIPSYIEVSLDLGFFS
jgi:hypothetical protein